MLEPTGRLPETTTIQASTMSLQLPKTKLFIHADKLTKKGDNDAVVAEFPLGDIDEVRVEGTADYPFPIAVILIFGSLAYVAKTYIPYTGLGWTAAIICIAIAAFAPLLINGRKIVIETTNGAVGYPVADAFEEADGFVISLKRRLSTIDEGDALSEPAD